MWNVDSVTREPPGIEVSTDGQDHDEIRHGEALLRVSPKAGTERNLSKVSSEESYNSQERSSDEQSKLSTAWLQLGCHPKDGIYVDNMNPLQVVTPKVFFNALQVVVVEDNCLLPRDRAVTAFRIGSISQRKIKLIDARDPEVQGSRCISALLANFHSVDFGLTFFYINTRDQIANGLQPENFTQKTNQLLSWTLTRQKSLVSNSSIAQT